MLLEFCLADLYKLKDVPAAQIGTVIDMYKTQRITEEYCVAIVEAWGAFRLGSTTPEEYFERAKSPCGQAT